MPSNLPMLLLETSEIFSQRMNTDLNLTYKIHFKFQRKANKRDNFVLYRGNHSNSVLIFSTYIARLFTYKDNLLSFENYTNYGSFSPPETQFQFTILNFGLLL